jgi:hypothetical protein
MFVESCWNPYLAWVCWCQPLLCLAGRLMRVILCDESNVKRVLLSRKMMLLDADGADRSDEGGLKISDACVTGEVVEPAVTDSWEGARASWVQTRGDEQISFLHTLHATAMQC